MIGPALIAAGGSLVSGLLSHKGAKDAQKINVAEAAKQRQFAERMRNTQWQAAVQDMEAAGINPALAYSQGPAASPSGASASVTDAVTPAVSTALQAKNAWENLRLIQDQRQLVQDQSAETKARTRKTRAEGVTAARTAEWDTARWAYYFDEHGKARKPLMDLLQEEHGRNMANSARSVWEAESARLSLPEREALAKLFENVGEGGKGAQLFLPLLLQLLRR